MKCIHSTDSFKLIIFSRTGLYIDRSRLLNQSNVEFLVNPFAKKNQLHHKNRL